MRNGSGQNELLSQNLKIGNGQMRTALILVGGDARRAGGKEKFFFLYDGKTFISHIIDSVGPVVDEIILVAKNRDQCERFSGFSEIRCVHDIRSGIGPIGGIHAGIQAARGDQIFISGCDMPFLNRDVVRYLFEELGGHDAVIPAWDKDMIEPLHGVYRKSALQGYLESHESLSLREMVRSLDANYVSIDVLRKINSDLNTFTNINKLEELDRINSMYGGNAAESPDGKKADP
jgi:molybdenum cofactor guanylyltransferase